MFTLAIFSLVFTSAQAQKQLGGEHNVEVNLTPFGNSPVDGTTIKYRNFLDDDKAFRVSLTVGSNSGTYAYFQEGEQLDDPVSPQLNMETSNTLIGIAPGYEIHFDARCFPVFRNICAFILKENFTNIKFCLLV